MTLLLDEKTQISVIAIAAFLAYCNVITAPFLHDDIPAIVNNPDVQVSFSSLSLQYSLQWKFFLGHYSVIKSNNYTME